MTLHIYIYIYVHTCNLFPIYNAGYVYMHVQFSYIVIGHGWVMMVVHKNFAEAQRIRFGPSIKITPSWCRRNKGGKGAQRTRPFGGGPTPWERPIWVVWPTWDAAFFGGVKNVEKQKRTSSERFSILKTSKWSRSISEAAPKRGSEAPLAQIGAGNTAQVPCHSEALDEH